jgi:nucleotide-binding universal stress UspA family protein
MSMKILCPTDFSDGSLKAIELACYLASVSDAEVMFISVFQEPRTAGRLGSIRDLIQKNTEDDLREFLVGLPMVSKLGSRWSYQVIGGHAADIIVRYAHIKAYDVVIMGTQGSSSLSNIVIGSTAQYVLNHSKIPVLVVPDYPVKYEYLKNTLIMLDEKPLDDKVLRPVAKLLELLNTKTSIYHLSDNEIGTQFDPMVKMVLGDSIKEIVVEKGDDPIESVKSYVKVNEIGLVFMIRHKHTWWERIFMQSNTDIGVFSMDVPLFVIPTA